MKRTVLFGAVMVFLGLAIAPRATVARRGDEVLALLCQRYNMTGHHTRELMLTFLRGKAGVRAAELTASGFPTRGPSEKNKHWGPTLYNQREEAVVMVLGDIRDMVCVEE